MVAGSSAARGGDGRGKLGRVGDEGKRQAAGRSSSMDPAAGSPWAADTTATLPRPRGMGR
jgi:hypothetical protein